MIQTLPCAHFTDKNNEAHESTDVAAKRSRWHNQAVERLEFELMALVQHLCLWSVCSAGPIANRHSIIKQTEAEYGGSTPVISEFRWEDSQVPLPKHGKERGGKMGRMSIWYLRGRWGPCSMCLWHIRHSLSLLGPTPLVNGLPHPPNTTFPFRIHIPPPPLPALRIRFCYYRYCTRTAHGWQQLTVGQNQDSKPGVPDCFRFLNIQQAPSSSCSPTSGILQLQCVALFLFPACHLPKQITNHPKGQCLNISDGNGVESFPLSGVV